MPLPPYKRSTEISQHLKQHPFVTKLEVRIKKLQHMMNSIYDIASSNLVLTDAESGTNDFSMNYYFADKLDKLSKHIINFGTTMSEKAAEIQE